MSIQSRIVRGIGYGAVAVSMLGFSLQAPATPSAGGAGGGYFKKKNIEARQAIMADDEQILIMAVKILFETGRL